MNADKFSRVTLVLDRRTDEQLHYLSRRTGGSRSEIVRNLLADPVDDLCKLMAMVPSDPKDVDLRQLAFAGLELATSLSEAHATTSR